MRENKINKWIHTHVTEEHREPFTTDSLRFWRTDLCNLELMISHWGNHSWSISNQGTCLCVLRPSEVFTKQTIAFANHCFICCHITLLSPISSKEAVGVTSICQCSNWPYNALCIFHCAEGGSLYSFFYVYTRTCSLQDGGAACRQRHREHSGNAAL